MNKKIGLCEEQTQLFDKKSSLNFCFIYLIFSATLLCTIW